MTKADMRVCCQCPPLYESEYRPEGDRPPVSVVLEAISHVTENDELDLPPLYDVIDTEGINRIFHHADDQTVLSFSYDDFNVFLRGDGRIRVCDAADKVDVAPVFERPLSE